MVSLKTANVCENCCCDKCEEIRATTPCCYCIPRWICVTVSGEGVPGNGCVNECSCIDSVDENQFNCELGSYLGGVACGGVQFDYEIFFTQDADGNCLLCITSLCANLVLGEGTALCQTITKGENDANACCEFDVTFASVPLVALSGGCGDTDCRYVDVNIKNVRDHFVPIQGCPCLEECFCITYGRETPPLPPVPECVTCFDFKKVCYNPNLSPPGWETTFQCLDEEIDMKITVECGDDGCPLPQCGLRLKSDVMFPDTDGDGGLLCYNKPHPALSWIMRDRTPEILVELISIIPADCHECSTVEESIACPGCCRSLDAECPPAMTLTATVIAPGCPEIDGRVATLFPGTGGCQGWMGTVSLGANPGVCSPVNFVINFFCGAAECGALESCKNYQLSVQVGNSSCLNNSDLGSTLGSCECDPPFFDFQVGGLSNNVPIGDCDCCGPFHIRITA